MPRKLVCKTKDVYYNQHAEDFESRIDNTLIDKINDPDVKTVQLQLF